jgi:hypothetical protein
VPMLFVLAVVVIGGHPQGPTTAWLEAVCEDRREGTYSCLPMTRTASAAIASRRRLLAVVVVAPRQR